MMLLQSRISLVSQYRDSLCCLCAFQKQQRKFAQQTAQHNHWNNNSSWTAKVFCDLIHLSFIIMKDRLLAWSQISQNVISIAVSLGHCSGKNSLDNVLKLIWAWFDMSNLDFALFPWVSILKTITAGYLILYIVFHAAIWLDICYNIRWWCDRCVLCTLNLVDWDEITLDHTGTMPVCSQIKPCRVTVWPHETVPLKLDVNISLMLFLMCSVSRLYS